VQLLDVPGPLQVFSSANDFVADIVAKRFLASTRAILIQEARQSVLHHEVRATDVDAE
jgi:hypothetical protein